MTLDISKLKALADKIAETGKDLNNAQSGGGDYEPPAEGATRVRLVSYVETGVHTETSRAFGSKTKPRCELTFELSGSKHAPKDIDGTLYPHRIVIRETIGYNEKNGFMKLFKLLNKDGTAKTFVDLIGKPFLAVVVHRKYKGNDGKERVAPQLKNTSGYTFSPVTYEDPATEQLVTIKVAEAITPLRWFIWDHADLDQWDAIFIDGQYDDGGSKNKLQLKIVSAQNFEGSEIHRALIEGKRTIPVPTAKDSAPSGTGDDGGDDGDGGEGAAEAPAAPPAPPKAKGKPTPAKPDADPLAGV